MRSYSSKISLRSSLQFRMHFGISSVGALPGGLPAERAEAAEALLRRNLLRHEDYCHFPPPAEPVNTGGDLPIMFADIQEEWRLAVMSGNPEVLSAAAQHWTHELGRRGVITPELLNSLLFRSRLVREILGAQADSALAERWSARTC